ncbi:MAG: LysR family transcriptional regulator [Negativicutes bacterium]|nr:LysR family transcriptional regulator [Negativicutes bacterium]
MYNSGLEAFVAVARTLNVSRAAQQLNLAQSTVSKRLNDLERELGTLLIERGQGAKSLRLTPEGEEFLDIALRWNSLWNQAQSLKAENRKLSLTIGTLDSLNYALFPPLYQALSQHQPKIRLRIITSHSPEIYDLIDRRQIDVGFSLVERTHPTLTVEKCYSEPMVVLRTSSTSRPDSGIVHLHDLDSRHELYVSSGISYQIWHDQRRDPLFTDSIRLDSAQLVFSFLCDEQQWAIVPLSVARMAKSRGNFSLFYLSDPPPERICYKITHKYPKASTVASLELLDKYLTLCLPGSPGRERHTL